VGSILCPTSRKARFYFRVSVPEVHERCTRTGLTIMAEQLDKRSRKILSEVIKSYIVTGEPVGSRTISKRSGLNLSPATVRNVMADLVDMGLLSQPHSSSGRIPTEHGLRLYVDSILEVEALTPAEKGAIERKINTRGYDVPEMLQETSRVLSRLSKLTSVVTAPLVSSVRLKHIEFLLLRKRIVLAILVDQTGLVQNKVIETHDDLLKSDLEKFSLYLNDLLKDLNLREIRKKIVQEMKKEKNRFDELMSRALKLSEQAFSETGDSTVYIQGQSSFLDQQEFANLDTMKIIFHALEEKTKLINLLSKTMKADGVQIFIGSECDLEGLEDVSFITSPYKKGYFPLGVLAVIGPARMNYSKVIPMVDYTARMVTNIFNNL
jgi:heat-inducible transcriptional repressor